MVMLKNSVKPKIRQHEICKIPAPEKPLDFGSSDQPCSFEAETFKIQMRNITGEY